MPSLHAVLPFCPYGYKFMFFPVKLSRGTGAWIRAVAIQDDWLNSHDVRLVDLSLPIMNHSFEPEQSRISTVNHDQNQRAKAKRRSEEHTSELQSLMRYSYAVFGCKKKKI